MKESGGKEITSPESSINPDPRESRGTTWALCSTFLWGRSACPGIGFLTHHGIGEHVHPLLLDLSRNGLDGFEGLLMVSVPLY